MSAEVTQPNSTEYNPSRRRSIGEIGLEIERNRKQEDIVANPGGKEGADKYKVEDGTEIVTKSERMRGREKRGRRSSVGALVASLKNILG
ncbi:hypothetical protein TrLO_g6025 [Triparma laevis f. longispina]|uniref:Uncharacterized protein n=1 Tax=Triparma laevis f. longispina TaxID=1714387 RepID=A0A9W7FR55_9STRA|nr:hypothetical protein TrLO_g6025 [Triparma laevis f. longispina]